MRSLSRERMENIAFLFLITAMAILMRILLFPFESSDYHQFLQNWYEQLKSNGGFAAIGMNIGDYMPTYLYLLAAFTYFPVSGLTAIKLISCAADIVLAVYVMKVVNLKYRRKRYGVAAYSILLFLPSVFLNSAVWGQCDAIFTAGLVACVYYFLKEQENKAMLAYAIAFFFKLQAVFLAPFLLVLLLKRKYRPRTLFVIPLLYIVAIIPAVIMGRGFWELLTVYFRQTTQYEMIAMFLPNLYTWLPEDTPGYIAAAGVILAGALVLISLFYFYKKRFVFTNGLMVSIALFYALFVPFVLPHMHERYDYPADILSVVFAFYFPEKIYVPAVVVLSSTYVVCHNLFYTDFFPVQLLAVVILGILILLAKHIMQEVDRNTIRRGKLD